MSRMKAWKRQPFAGQTTEGSTVPSSRTVWRIRDAILPQRGQVNDAERFPEALSPFQVPGRYPLDLGKASTVILAPALVSRRIFLIRLAETVPVLQR